MNVRQTSVCRRNFDKRKLVRHQMRLNRFTIRFSAAVVLVCSGTLASVSGQERQWARDELIAEAREIMTATRYCALITIDRSGRAQARTMDAFAPDEKMVVWFGTNPQ